MDSEGQAYEMLDLLAYHCNDLSRQLKESPEQEKAILHEYLGKVNEEFEPIDEFADGL